MYLAWLHLKKDVERLDVEAEKTENESIVFAIRSKKATYLRCNLSASCAKRFFKKEKKKRIPPESSLLLRLHCSLGACRRGNSSEKKEKTRISREKKKKEKKLSETTKRKSSKSRQTKTVKNTEKNNNQNCMNCGNSFDEKYPWMYIDEEEKSWLFIYVYNNCRKRSFLTKNYDFLLPFLCVPIEATLYQMRRLDIHVKNSLNLDNENEFFQFLLFF